MMSLGPRPYTGEPLERWGQLKPATRQDQRFHVEGLGARYPYGFSIGSDFGFAEYGPSQFGYADYAASEGPSSLSPPFDTGPHAAHFAGGEFSDERLYGGLVPTSTFVWHHPAFAGSGPGKTSGHVLDAVKTSGHVLGSVDHSIQDAAGNVTSEIRKVPITGDVLRTFATGKSTTELYNKLIEAGIQRSKVDPMFSEARRLSRPTPAQERAMAHATAEHAAEQVGFGYQKGSDEDIASWVSPRNFNGMTYDARLHRSWGNFTKHDRPEPVSYAAPHVPNKPLTWFRLAGGYRHGAFWQDMGPIVHHSDGFNWFFITFVQPIKLVDMHHPNGAFIVWKDENGREEHLYNPDANHGAGGVDPSFIRYGFNPDLDSHGRHLHGLQRRRPTRAEAAAFARFPKGTWILEYTRRAFKTSDSTLRQWHLSEQRKAAQWKVFDEIAEGVVAAAGVAVNLIPGIGQVASVAILSGLATAKGIIDSAHSGNWSQVAQNTLSIAAQYAPSVYAQVNPGQIIPPEVVSDAGKHLHKMLDNPDVKRIVDTYRGHPKALADNLTQYLQHTGKVAASKTSSYLAHATGNVRKELEARAESRAIASRAHAGPTPEQERAAAQAMARAAAKAAAAAGRHAHATYQPLKSKRGFDLGAGLMMHQIAAHDLVAARDSLTHPFDKMGFDMAVATHVGAVANPKPTSIRSAAAHAGYAITMGMRSSNDSRQKAAMMRAISQDPVAAVGAKLAVKQSAKQTTSKKRIETASILGAVAAGAALVIR